MGKLSMELYLANVLKRYKAANKREKGIILNELCESSGFHKKHAIRLLNSRVKQPKSKKLKQGRPSRYPATRYLEPLKRIWLLSDQPCGKRLKMALPLWLPHYGEAYEHLDSEVYDGLLSMSAATIDRLLLASRVKYKRSMSGTKPGSLLKKHIPIATNQWDEEKPGFLEADTVAHCGTSLSGNFVWSLTMTDINSGWTELRAVWNKGASGVVMQIEDIENSLPFPILGFDCDNGSEFLNWQMNNFFLPNFKLIEKQRVASKVIKKHSKPATPYQRLMTSTHISEIKKQELTKIYNELNPFQLQKTIQKKLKQIFVLVNGKSDSKMSYT